jgi:hypothetical protein
MKIYFDTLKIKERKTFLDHCEKIIEKYKENNKITVKCFFI